ncbi:hypothetical protein BDV10DRAFT_179889 [Aspergillus recurvatus]
MYQRALAGYGNALGADHPITCMVATNLASLTSFGAERSIIPHPVPSEHLVGQVLGLNAPRTSLPEGPRKRDFLYRIFRIK